jgi:hypothetical protein
VHDFGAPQQFVPQKIIAKRRLVTGMVAVLLMAVFLSLM